MHRITRVALGVAATVALTASGGTAQAATGDLDAFEVTLTPAHVKTLAEAGFDVTEGRDSKAGAIQVVGTSEQLRGLKVGATAVRDAQGRTIAERSRQRFTPEPRTARKAPGDASDPARTASDADQTVYTKYDAVAGDDKEQFTEQYDRLAAEHPDLVKERVFGTTANGRQIIGLQVTKGATGTDIPGRPAVLYNALQHAREWLAGETCRRTLEYVVDNYGKGTSAGEEVTPLVDANELWFVCVNNPDGYEYTFTPGNRLWRKNLRDNDGDGVIKSGDGVDPNRNFARNWGLDDEGSSPDPADETYRGPSAASEPETKAMEKLFDEVKPVFQKNDHTAAELLLYPQGFQQDTPTADDEIFTALAGDPFKPGIEGFLPELSAGLYITNGDFTDWAYGVKKTLSYTPEGTASEGTGVFEYPDSEQLIQQEFRRHLPFALDLAKSAGDPTKPVSHLGNTADPITVDAFPVSYGSPQLVQATVQRKLGDARLHYKVAGGQEYSVPTSEFTGGKRYDKDDAVYYHRVRGVIGGVAQGQSVEAWFVAGGVQSPRFTYVQAVVSDKPVLLLSDEDWTGKQPNAAPLAGPQYLDAYKQLLDQAGVPYDVYDVAAKRQRPDPLGVLSHYSHIIWYSGDDYVPRAPDAPGGSGIDKLAVDTQNDVRDFLNEGGKLFYTGQNAGRAFAEGYTYNPFQEQEGEYCDTSAQCIAVQDDFLQYWLGAGSYVSDAGADPDGLPLPISGTAGPFAGDGPYAQQETDSTGAPVHTATLLTTSSLYDPVAYPQFAAFQKVLGYDRLGASPYEPYTGDWFASAGATNASYKRLLTPADLTGKTAATFSFRTSYDLEPDYDFLFAEIHTVGQDDWTTLAADDDQTSTDVGLSCPSTGDGSDWQSIHPFLSHYQTKNAAGTACTPTGSSGTWNAATGNSGGWQQWTLPIPAAYLGKQVEISITTATDPASLGLGTFVDDAKLTATPAATLLDTSFETSLAPFTTPGPPAGDLGVSAVDWTRAQSAPFVEGAAVATKDTVYFAFGLEKIADPAGRRALLDDVFAQLGAPAKPQLAAPTPTAEGVPPTTTPDPGTPPPPATTNRGLDRFTISRQRLKAVLRRGLRLGVRCSDGCRVRFTASVPASVRKRLGLRSRTLASKAVTVKPGLGGSVVLTLKPATKRRLGRSKRLKVSVQATVSSTATINKSRRLSVTLR